MATSAPTRSGLLLDLADPQPSQVCIEDIAHSLSQQCRFNGHTRDFYSVAEHSVRVSWAVPEGFRLVALMHDAHEAYTGDITLPMRNLLGPDLVEKICDRVQSVIADKFDFHRWTAARVHEADKVLVATEARDQMNADFDDPRWMLPHPPLDEVIEPWGILESRRRFLRTFELLRP